MWGCLTWCSAVFWGVMVPSCLTFCAHIILHSPSPAPHIHFFQETCFIACFSITILLQCTLHTSFHRHNPSGRTMALALTQPLTEMSTRNISWGVKVASAYGWQPYHLQVPIVLKSGNLNLLEPSGPVLACNVITIPVHTRHIGCHWCFAVRECGFFFL